LIFKFAGMSRIGLNARHSAYSEFLASQLLIILELLRWREISKGTGPAKNYISIKEHSTKFNSLADQPHPKTSAHSAMHPKKNSKKEDSVVANSSWQHCTHHQNKMEKFHFIKFPDEVLGAIIAKAIFDKQGDDMESTPSLMSQVHGPAWVLGQSEVWMLLRQTCKSLNHLVIRLNISPPKIFMAKRGFRFNGLHGSGFDKEGLPAPELTRRPEDEGTLQFPRLAGAWMWRMLASDVQRIGEEWALIRKELTPVGMLPVARFGRFYKHVYGHGKDGIVYLDWTHMERRVQQHCDTDFQMITLRPGEEELQEKLLEEFIKEAKASSDRRSEDCRRRSENCRQLLRKAQEDLDKNSVRAAIIDGLYNSFYRPS
jgi:hypothetical protein